MKQSLNLKKIFGSTLGLSIIFIIVFYLLTYLVYYFYGPGPEERKMQETQQAAQITHGDQSSSVTVKLMSPQGQQM